MAVNQTPTQPSNPLVSVLNPSGIDPNQALSALTEVGEGNRNRAIQYAKIQSEDRRAAEEMALKKDEIKQLREETEKDRQFQERKFQSERALAVEDRTKRDALEREKMAAELKVREQERQDNYDENVIQDKLLAASNDLQVELEKVEQQYLEALKSGNSALSVELKDRTDELNRSLEAIRGRAVKVSGLHGLKSRMFEKYADVDPGTGQTRSTNVWSAAHSAYRNQLSARQLSGNAVIRAVMNGLSLGSGAPPQDKDEMGDFEAGIAMVGGAIGSLLTGGEEGGEDVLAGYEHFKNAVKAPVDPGERTLDAVAEAVAGTASGGDPGKVQGDLKVYLQALEKIKSPDNKDDEAWAKAASGAYERLLQEGLSEDAIALTVHSLSAAGYGGAEKVGAFYADKGLAGDEQGESLDFGTWKDLDTKAASRFAGLEAAANRVGVLIGDGTRYRVDYQKSNPQQFDVEVGDLIDVASDGFLTEEEVGKIFRDLSPEMQRSLRETIEPTLAAYRDEVSKAMGSAGLSREYYPNWEEEVTKLEDQEKETTAEKDKLEGEYKTRGQELEDTLGAEKASKRSKTYEENRKRLDEIFKIRRKP